jgi:hypothetical protein
VIRPVSQETKEFIVTKMIRFGAIALMLMTTAASAQDGAQDKPAPASPKPAVSPAPPRPQIPLRLQLVLSRYQGEKKLSSVPYVMWVTSNEGRNTMLRMGVKIPVYSGGGGMGSYNYQEVGTNIDCSVTTAPDSMYKVSGTIADSSVYFSDPKRPNAAVPAPVSDTAPPALRSFTSTFSILLRDGQTGQYTSAVDQASGEVLKIDATLNVLK